MARYISSRYVRHGGRAVGSVGAVSRRDDAAEKTGPNDVEQRRVSFPGVYHSTVLDAAPLVAKLFDRLATERLAGGDDVVDGHARDPSSATLVADETLGGGGGGVGQGRGWFNRLDVVHEGGEEIADVHEAEKLRDRVG